MTPESERSSREKNGSPLQYSCLGNPMDRGACQATVHWLTKELDTTERLQVPWTARRSNQSILKETSPGGSLEELMLRLKLQYFGHLVRRADSFEKTLMLGKIEGRGEGGNRG